MKSKIVLSSTFFVKLFYHGVHYARDSFYRVRLQRATISKKEFIDDLRAAIEKKVGYAVGKIGKCEQHCMYYEILLKKGKNSKKVRQFEKTLFFDFLNQLGLFPVNRSFILHYNQSYVEDVRNLDCLGICYYPREPEILKYYQLKNKVKLIYYNKQEPDRSSPSNEHNCYLQYFEGKKLLLICPFAELLRERANKETFERVWAKTGKRWFYPKKVEALEFPYGFSKKTQEIYPTAIDLFEYIKKQIDEKDFDIALIAAAGLANPIASYIKSIGKVGISLGGHLQVLFGVIGKRWRDRKDWKKLYFNDYWIDMPEKFKPRELALGVQVCDGGAYW